MINRLRYWIAQPLLDALTDQHQLDLVIKYRDGFEAGLKLGQAAGHLQGQQQLLAQLSQASRQEELIVSTEDIERAKQGLIH